MGDLGSFFIRMWWGGNPDAKNEVSGLSLRDINNLQTSWKKIQENSIENGILMFLRLFRAQPETKLLFQSVAHLHSDEEITENIMFRAHTALVMSHLDNTIVNLNKPELVVAFMQKVGDTHRRLKAEKKHFWVRFCLDTGLIITEEEQYLLGGDLMFKDILVNILQNDLKFAENVVESWKRYVTFSYEHLLPRLAS